MTKKTDCLEARIIGNSAGIAMVRQLVRHVAPTDATVLLMGPSGSGKEVVARAVHALSGRAEQQFIAINCGAIPAELLESQLFGHERGAFTGAHAQHKGCFEASNGGSLFLDEIGDMPVDMQVKLLRVLEERTIQRVGGRGEISIDVRIVAATHRDLDQAIEAGRFREDLFYRLAVFPIEIPSLSQRIEDLPDLIDHFAGSVPREGRVTFSRDALTRLAEHHWPGNVRELRNLAERASIMWPGRTIDADQAAALLLRRGRMSAAEQLALWQATEDRPAAVAEATANVVSLHGDIVIPRPDFSAEKPVPLRELLAEIERRYIEEALARSEGVVADAARLLSLQRTTLIEKLRRHDLKVA
jgi:sigma-54 dependent transcriptional regulator, flagellar regulatory protein